MNEMQQELRRQFFFAVLSNELEKVKKLIRELIKNETSISIAGDWSIYTALHIATYGGYQSIAELLLVNGTNVNAVDYHGVTPLHIAAYRGSQEIAELLLANEADINAVDKNRNTPLHTAVYGLYGRVVKLLLADGADVNAVNHDGNTPLSLISVSSLNSIFPSSDFFKQYPDSLDYIVPPRNDYEDVIECVIKPIINHIAKLEAAGLYVSEQNLQKKDELVNSPRVKEKIFMHNHKPLINALSTLGCHKADTVNEIKASLEENEARFKVKLGVHEKSLIDFVNFEDTTTFHAPRLKLCAAVSEVVKNNTQLSSSSVKQHQAAAQARN